MKNVIIGKKYESPKQIMGVFNESIMEFEVQWVCMGKGFGPTGLGNIYTKYLNIESSKLKTDQGVHKSLIR